MASIKLKPELFESDLDQRPFSSFEANFESLVSSQQNGQELICFYDFLIQRIRHQQSLLPKWAQGGAWDVPFETTKVSPHPNGVSPHQDEATQVSSHQAADDASSSISLEAPLGEFFEAAESPN